jgi:DNA-binding NarL/FixJ family response regulator
MTQPIRHDDEPRRPLTTRQQQVANLLGRGWSYKRIGLELGISGDTVQTHVEEIANKLLNPDELAAGTLVMLWSAHRLWLKQPVKDRSSAA